MGAARDELGWADVERLAGVLAAQVAGAAGVQGFDRVLGVARGGLVPAVLLACHLGVKQLESVQVRLYDGARRLPAPRLLGPAPASAGPSGDPARTLVVDEIFDSGATMSHLHRLLPRATLCALVARHAPDRPVRTHGDLRGYACAADPTGATIVWAVEAIETDAWILFPWSPPEDRAAGTASA
jgi:xanthine phosphoribosyltransferase